MAALTNIREGWRACLAWVTHPDCAADESERGEMLSFASANADAAALSDIYAKKEEHRRTLRRKRKAAAADKGSVAAAKRHLATEAFFATEVRPDIPALSSAKQFQARGDDLER